MTVGRIVLATTARERGGLWKNLVDLAVAFHGRGHDVTVAVPGDATALREDAKRRGLAYAELSTAARRPGGIWHLHLPKPFDRRTLPLLAAARLRGYRVFVTEHMARHPSSDSSMPWGPGHVPGLRKPGAAQVKTALKRAEAGLADRVIAVSENSRQFILRRFGLAGDKCTVVLNGVAPAAPHPLPPLAGGLRVAVVGAVTHKKGHDVLVDAVLRSTGDWRVNVFGAGDQLNELRRRTAGVTDRIRFHGWVDDVDQRLRDHHLLCMPSRYEQLPYAVTEAMMHGRPVIATDVDGIPEAVRDGVNGLVVPVGDAAALARALDHAAADPDAVRRWAAAAHDTATTMFSLPVMADRIFTLYQAAATR